ncbi:hypothetical protein [Lysinibacillus sphaericus]|nr:hypothetical protein [Lysinibacillus sphaericus]
MEENIVEEVKSLDKSEAPADAYKHFKGGSIIYIGGIKDDKK